VRLIKDNEGLEVSRDLDSMMNESRLEYSMIENSEGNNNILESSVKLFKKIRKSEVEKDKNLNKWKEKFKKFRGEFMKMIAPRQIKIDVRAEITIIYEFCKKFIAKDDNVLHLAEDLFQKILKAECDDFGEMFKYLRVKRTEKYSKKIEDLKIESLKYKKIKEKEVEETKQQLDEKFKDDNESMRM
jgi:hypothetical protein